MQVVKYKDILIAPERQRKEFKSEELVELANSIAKNGLLHPPVVRKGANGTYTLVAGERRLKAIDYLWGMGEGLRYENKLFIEGNLPVHHLGDLDPIDAFEAELEENIRRVDLTWQERAEATSQLFELRKLQSERAGGTQPTVATLSQEAYPESHPVAAQHATRADLILARHLKDPDVAKASSKKEGLKILKRKEELKRSVELGESVGKTFGRSSHTLLQGDCLKILPTLPSETFDVILTDPPYGIEAQDFGDSAGKTFGAHFYDDTLESFKTLMHSFGRESIRITKPQGHLYLFCDLDNFLWLRSYFSDCGWKVFRTPLIWFNPGGMRAPWPTQGPQRKYQACLYAVKGDKPTLQLAGDILTHRSDPNLNHPAQKPVSLYEELLKRSCRPGDLCIDPFCGSGTIFPAAHSLKVKATGIELDPAAYGIAVKRLDDLP